MSKRTTFERLSDILIEQLGIEPSDITHDARIVEDLGAERSDTAAVIAAIEREWNLELDEDASEPITTVEEFITLIEDLCR